MALFYPAVLAVFVPIWAFCYWVLPYFTTYKHLRHIPGPFVCKFSNLWLALGARKGQKYIWVHAAHQKYGDVVRLGYKHISIATPEGLRIIYAHGNGFLKDVYYDAFVSGVPGVFNVRDRGEHTRKRKIVAHAFSPGAVQDFEPHMARNLERWVAQLDRMAASAVGPAGDAGKAYARVNIMPWCTFLAFDIIGDLAFGAPFGMVGRGLDACESSLPGGPITYVPGAESLNRRGEVSSTLGLLPELRPWARFLPHPFIYKGLRSIEHLHGIAHVAVMKRLCARNDDRGDRKYDSRNFQHEHDDDHRNRRDEEERNLEKNPHERYQHHQKPPHTRHDILEMLCRGKDAAGHPMPAIELVSEALTQLIAGSDTVSNTACAVIYYILDGERRRPGTITARLQAELDSSATNPSTTNSSSSSSSGGDDNGMRRRKSTICTHAEVRALPFLRRCIDEAMRLHSTSATGLPRIATSNVRIPSPSSSPHSPSSLQEAYTFPAGTILSVPSYTLHHSASIWGPGVEDFDPSRWETLTPRQKSSFNPFSYGPRACVGQNVAYMELALIVGTVFRRYEFELYQPAPLESHEGFTKKPVECWVGLRRR